MVKSSTTLTIGAHWDPAYVFNGRVDEVALYKRVLNANERTWLYNSGNGRAYSEVTSGATYNYSTTHKHAVTSLSGNTYVYDANGNQVTRVIGADTYTLSYDAENRMVKVQKTTNSVTTIVATFTYDADGKRVKSVINGETIQFIGAHYEIKNGSEITKYYMAGSTRVAMRKYTIPQNMTVEYMLGDHLGSTSLTTDTNGAKVSEIRYKPWGEVRYAWTDAPANTSPVYALTRYTFTGQYAYLDDPTTSASEGFGLMFYNARWLDPVTGRFAQADSIVPGGAQGLDRYAYVNNNPVRYNDPTGHKAGDMCDRGYEDCEDDIVIPFDTDEIVQKIPGTAEQWADAAQLLDEAALAYDTLLGIYVLVWVGIGLGGGLMFEGNPVTGAVGAAAGYIVGEGNVALSGALFPGNAVATVATGFGLISDMKSGNTSVQGSLSLSPEGVNLTASGQVSSNALTSVGLSTLGWAANIVTLSLPMQAAAVANDRGWFPSTNIPFSLKLNFSLVDLRRRGTSNV